jgi:hypothetical protein
MDVMIGMITIIGMNIVAFLLSYSALVSSSVYQPHQIYGDKQSVEVEQIYREHYPVGYSE